MPKKYRLLRDWPDAVKGDFYQWNGQGYSNQNRTAMVISKACVESYDTWFEEIKEKERITTRVVPFELYSEGKFFGYYMVEPTKAIPKEKLPSIKQAIESILNNEQPKEETKNKQWELLDRDVKAPLQKVFVDGIEFVPQQSNNQPLSGELITKEECERQKIEAFQAGRGRYVNQKNGETYYDFPTYEDYQQSLK